MTRKEIKAFEKKNGAEYIGTFGGYPFFATRDCIVTETCGGKYLMFLEPEDTSRPAFFCAYPMSIEEAERLRKAAEEKKKAAAKAATA